MRQSAAMAAYDRWDHPCYEVRVRGTMYLWGSAGITANITFGNAQVLHVRNDVFGEAIGFGTQVASGAQTSLGTLQAGECVSIPLQNISGVYATCAIESTVACLIKGSE